MLSSRGRPSNGLPLLWKGFVVGRPGGPAEKPLGYGGREGRTPTFPRAKEVLEFVSSQEVVEKKLIRYPTREFGRRYPY